MKKEKQFFINGRENEVLLKDWDTSDGCIATDRITVNTICQYDPDIIPLLHAPYGTAYIRDENGEFQEEPFEPLEE